MPVRIQGCAPIACGIALAICRRASTSDGAHRHQAARPRFPRVNRRTGFTEARTRTAGPHPPASPTRSERGFLRNEAEHALPLRTAPCFLGREDADWSDHGRAEVEQRGAWPAEGSRQSGGDQWGEDADGTTDRSPPRDSHRSALPDAAHSVTHGPPGRPLLAATAATAHRRRHRRTPRPRERGPRDCRRYPTEVMPRDRLR